IVVCGVGGVFVVRNGEPVGVELVRSVRTSLAIRTAPSTFTSPAPCSSMLKYLSGCAVYISNALIMMGVSLGLAWSKRAAVPATTTIPAFTSARAARQTGSFRYELIAGAPRLIFTTRILYLSLFSGLLGLTAFVGSAAVKIQFRAFSRATLLPVP